jgi:hypothetical protein
MVTALVLIAFAAVLIALALVLIEPALALIDPATELMSPAAPEIVVNSAGSGFTLARIDSAASLVRFS